MADFYDYTASEARTIHLTPDDVQALARGETVRCGPVTLEMRGVSAVERAALVAASEADLMADSPDTPPFIAAATERWLRREVGL